MSTAIASRLQERLPLPRARYGLDAWLCGAVVVLLLWVAFYAATPDYFLMADGEAPGPAKPAPSSPTARRDASPPPPTASASSSVPGSPASPSSPSASPIRATPTSA